MIAMLDQLDGDPDLEPDLTGSPNQGAACDAEGDDSELELSGDENEPSLGSLGSTMIALMHPQVPAWAGGGVEDFELDDCDLEEGGDDEPHTDDEPSLGSTGGTAMAVDGQGWGGCDGSDRELDLSDREPSLGWPEEVGAGSQALVGRVAGRHDDADVPTGFARVHRALADERRETREETQRLTAIIRRLSGAAEPHGGNLRMVSW